MSRSRIARLRTLQCVASALAILCFGPAIGAGKAAPQPVGQPGAYTILKDWTFGNQRPDATIHNRSDLDKEFYYRYIYNKGKLDGLSNNYWSFHRDYPEGDPKSLHVFGPKSLTLKGRIPPGGGLFPRGIESGMLRAKLAITPGMYIEMRAKMTTGVGAWPAFWLNPGVQYEDGTFSALPWPPEIDIFEFFNWYNRPKTLHMLTNVQTHKMPEKYGNPHDIFKTFEKKEYSPGFDFSEDFHVFALDWRENEPIWLVDGVPIRQMYYEWHAPPAHLLITNQIGIRIAKADMSKMVADESQWNYVIDYIRIWRNDGPKPQPPQHMEAE